ncbi:MAG: phage tail spike protein [Eubacteriales bacterium]|nr:phage tail spike protein [Eubacteriales bacterium]
MIPCLYPSNETKFTDNGIGKLADCQSCLVSEKRNGSFELKMEYPPDGIHAPYLEEGNIILAKPAEQAASQPFCIYKITTKLTDCLEVLARHISYQLNFITVSPFSVSGCRAALAGLKEKAAADCPFAFWTDVESGAAFQLPVPVSVRNALGGMDGSVLDTFGGEYEWDRYAVRLHRARGRDNGVRIVYGKNLVDFQMERNIENVITGVHPYWQDSESGAVMELPEKIVRKPAKSVPYQRITPFNCTDQFTEKPTAAQMRSYASDYLETTSLTEPDVDITIDFLQLWQTPGYADIAQAERVSLCDTVWVYIAKLGIEVSSKVTETEYDVLLEKYKSVTLSNSVVSSRNRSLSASLGSIRSEANSAYQAAIRVEASISDVSALAENQGYFNVMSAAMVGFHYSSGTDDNGNVVRYAYNAVSLETSTLAWKSGRDGLFVSRDGGKTWEYGWNQDYGAVATVFQTLELSDEVLKTLDDRYREAGELTAELMGLLDSRYETSGKLTEALWKKLDEKYGRQQITVSEEAPKEPKLDALWVDKSMDPKQLKLWNGSAWEAVSYGLPEEPDTPEEGVDTNAETDNHHNPAGG